MTLDELNKLKREADNCQGESSRAKDLSNRLAVIRGDGHDNQ